MSDNSTSPDEDKDTMMNKTLGMLFATMAAVAMLTTGLVGPAEAGRLKAQIYITQAQIPRSLTEKGLIGFARSHNAKRMRETNDKELEKRKWKGNLVVAFNAPVNDTEFSVLFYDIHEGAPRMVEDMSTFVNDRKQRTFVQKFSLPRPRFKPNRNMELVVTVKRQEVGRTKFGVVGDEVRRSGQVSFSDEER